MAGKSGRGVELSEAELFRDATYVLTPIGAALPNCPAMEEFLGWIQKIGAHPLVLSAKLHDEIVAWTSHLPQLVSSALAACLMENLPNEDHLRIAGSGLRDMTRLAESPFDIWKDIFSTNRENLDRALVRLIGLLEQFRSDLATEKLGRQFELARLLRKKLLTKPNP
jgi:prephenate dehydrogenase